MTTKPEINGRRGRVFASAAAALLLAGGITTIGLGLNAGQSRGDGPAPAVAASAPATTSASPAPATASPSSKAGTTPALKPSIAMKASTPVSVQAPAIGLSTPLLQLGQQADGEVQVPPGEPGSPAGWYKYSPTPGETGSSVILGHVNNTQSPIGVFYRLHDMRPGQQITVTRADHTVAVFTVDRVDVYHKSSFPTVKVYRNADRPELRLITCGGYDPASGEYLDNTVVYAHLVSHHAA